MNDDNFEHIERQIAAGGMPGAPSLLRAKVLADAQRELRAARWDQRLARAAAVLLVLGVGLNVANATGSSALNRPVNTQIADVRSSVVDTAIVVAEMSDATTAQEFARQIAAAMGHKLTDDEEAAISKATERAGRTSGGRG